MAVHDFFSDERSPIERTDRRAVGARLPNLQVRLVDDDATPVDLTGGTIVFSMDDEDGVAKVTAQAGALVGDGKLGTIEYAWAAADVDTAKRYFGQFKVTIGGKDHLIPNNSSQKMRIEIGAAI